MRVLTGFGTPKAAADAFRVALCYLHAGETTLLFLLVTDRRSRLAAALAVTITADDPPLSTGC